VKSPIDSNSSTDIDAWCDLTLELLRSRAAGGVNAAGAVRGFVSFNDSLASRRTSVRPKVLD
jgi:hypothetical protein